MLRRNKCFVPGCKTGTNRGKRVGMRDGLNKKTLFRAPEDKYLLDKWKRNIPRVGENLIPGCFVCEVHFKEEEIERSRKRINADGSISLFKRVTPKLKTGAIPTVFPDLPNLVFKSLKKIDCPLRVMIDGSFNSTQPILSAPSIPESKEMQQNSPSEIEKDDRRPVNDNEISSSHSEVVKANNSSGSLSSTVRNGSQDGVTSSTNDKTSMNIKPVKTMRIPFAEIEEMLTKKGFQQVCEVCKSRYAPPETDNTNKSSSSDDWFQIIVAGFEEGDEPLGFEKLKSDIYQISLPNQQWSFSILDDGIAFINWAWYYEARKKVIITKKLMYRIFVRDKEIKLEGYDGPTSVEDVTKILQVVDEIPVCYGLGPNSGWSKECTGYVPLRGEEAKKPLKMTCDDCLKQKRRLVSEKRKEERKKQIVKKLLLALSQQKSQSKALTLMVNRMRKKNAVLTKQLHNTTTDNILSVIEMNDNIDLDVILNEKFTLSHRETGSSDLMEDLVSVEEC